jgi:hypothetical protein
MTLRKAAAMLVVALAAGALAGCDRPAAPGDRPGPGADVPQPKTGANAPGSAGSSGRMPSGGATGPASESPGLDQEPKRRSRY